MDASNFVSNGPNGTFVVYRNGQLVGYYATQQQAEQAYNTAGGGWSGGTSPSVTPAPYQAPTPSPTQGPQQGQQGMSNFPGALQALAQSHQVDIDWEKQKFAQAQAQQQAQFDVELRSRNDLSAAQRAEMAREFDLQQKQQQAQFDADLTLRKQAAETQKTQFGQSLYSNLAQGLLSTASGLRGPENYLSYANATQGGRNIFDTLFGSQAAPSFGAQGYNAPMNLQSLLGALGISGENMPGGSSAFTQAVQAITGGQGSQSQPQQGQPRSTQVPSMPNPWQINPGVWDSMSDTARKMAVATAQAGGTPSGAWTAEDFMNQLNASRPQGQAPRRVQWQWGSPKSWY